MADRSIDAIEKFARAASRRPAIRAAAIPIYRLGARSVIWRRPPKVIAISMPKAGTHLVGRVLGMLPAMTFSGQHLSEEQVFHGDDSNRSLDLAVVGQMFNQCRNGQFMTGHFPHHTGLQRLLERSGIAPLVMVRDPRDVAVSYVHYVCNEPRHFHHEHFTTTLTSFDERLMATLQGFAPPARCAHGLASLRTAVLRYQPWLDTPTPIIRFEELVGPRGGGSSEQQLEQIRRISQAVDRPLSEAQVNDIAKRAFSTGSRTFRAGAAGGWANVFNNDHLTWCRSELDPVLEGLGYEPSSRLKRD